MNLSEFVAKWSRSTLTERAGAQQHFLDLCAILNQPAPAEADPTGERYAFEKGVSKVSGGQGFADVWMRGHFAIEYKGRRKNLGDAYQQLLAYREDLENPPLLVVCDLNRFEVHTNFTGTVKRVFGFTLADLAAGAATPTCPIPPLVVLRALFEDPERLRPTQTAAQVTETAAVEFGKIAAALRDRGAEPHAAARFLIRLLFCLFAEDIGLLPPALFTRLVENTRHRPADFNQLIRNLFAQMAGGGWFGTDRIAHFNGGLFADDTALELSETDLATLAHAATLDWASIEPSIFGTLFERGLDPKKRSQLGAHYTSRDDILRIVEPVLMAPLRRRWSAVQEQARALIARRDAVSTMPGRVSPQRARLDTELGRLLQNFSEALAAVRVLDPACGSGNFLYVALRQLLDLEKEAITFAGASGLTSFFPRVGPEQMSGIERDDYAHELAPVTVWIGYIQWLRDNGFGRPSEPILRPMETIVQRDAVLAFDAEGQPVEPVWPDADVIIGNPPFLGGKRLRTELGDDYVDRLFRLYDKRVPREADLVTYWFERARTLIEGGKAQRAGLLATNSIRGGANRRVLERIKASGDIFMAWSDRPWILDGAAVRVSMVGFDNGTEQERTLDDQPAEAINPDLTGALNLTAAKRLPENFNLAFMGDTKGGGFDIPSDVAAKMLAAPPNPNGRPNSDVVKPWVNGLDVTRRPRNMWIIDFGVNMSEEDAALYEQPFGYVLEHVKPERMKNNRAAYRERWWLHVEPRPALRAATAPRRRFIATPTVAKHRLFVWLERPTLPDHQLIVIAREDDYFFGVLHSKPHELWALRMGTSLEDRPRYTPTTTFETFPFPWPPSLTPGLADSATSFPAGKGEGGIGRTGAGIGHEAIADAARRLVELRDNWLNPSGATDPEVSRAADTDAELRKRTLTNLYNERPAWLANAHRKLDEAVLAAYGWPADLTDDDILARLLALNQERAG